MAMKSSEKLAYRNYVKEPIYSLFEPNSDYTKLLRNAQKARAERVSTEVRNNLPEVYLKKYMGDLGASEIVQHGGIKMPTKDQAVNAAKTVLNMFSSGKDSSNSAQSVSDPYTIIPWNSSGSSGFLPMTSSPTSGFGAFQDQVDANNQLSIALMRENNQFNADQAAFQRAWQTEMANTAHQREVADLMAAGLNPVLSAGGTGAVTPSGGMASNAGYSNVSGSEVISAMATMAAAALSSNAAITAAQTSANASMWNAVTNKEGSIDVAKINADASRYGSDRTKYGAIYKLLETFMHSYVQGDHSYVDNLFG